MVSLRPESHAASALDAAAAGLPTGLPPEQGGAQSGTQIDESLIDAPGDDHSPTTENDVT